MQFKGKAAALQALATFFIFTGGSPVPLAGEEPKPEIQFEEEAWDFGLVREGEKVSHLFPFRNLGGADLFITKVRSSCDCVAATVSLERVAPGEKGGVVVTFDSRDRQDRQMRNVWVHSNDPDEPTVVLQLTGVVEANVLVRPSRLVFKDFSRGEPISESLRIVPVTLKLRTVRVEPTWEYLSAETRRIAEGEGGFEVVVSLSPLAPQGEFEEELLLYLNDEDSPSKSVPVYIRVGGEVVVVPEHLSFRALKPGESVSGRVRVSSREGADLEILRVESDLLWVGTEVVTLEKGRAFEIAVTLRPKRPIDERRSEIRIFTNHPEQSVIAVPLFFYRFR